MIVENVKDNKGERKNEDKLKVEDDRIDYQEVDNIIIKRKIIKSNYR